MLVYWRVGSEKNCRRSLDGLTWFDVAGVGHWQSFNRMFDAFIVGIADL